MLTSVIDVPSTTLGYKLLPDPSESDSILVVNDATGSTKFSDIVTAVGLGSVVQMNLSRDY